MIRSPLASTLFVSLLAGASGCTALARIEAPSLNGTPDSTGVVVVEPDITVIAALFGLRTTANPVSGVLVRIDGPEEIVESGKSSGFIVFPDLSPGRWQLLSIEAEWQTGNSNYYRYRYAVPLDSAEDFAFDVRPGEPIYVLAEIEDDRHTDTLGVRFARRNDPEAERKAWAWMSDVYEKSAWEPIFRSRLSAAH